MSISGGKQNVVLSHTEHDPAVARSEAGTHAATCVNAENPRPSEVRTSVVYAYFTKRPEKAKSQKLRQINGHQGLESLE